MPKSKLTADSVGVRLAGILSSLDSLSGEALEVLSKDVAYKEENDLDVIKQSLVAVRESVKTADFVIKNAMIRVRSGEVSIRDFIKQQEEKGG